ncbi:MAG: relaxase/mobilization nuclease domain-containing protein [Desulfobacteraceae bacterium]|nr:relaxase/mobilization nuclease domain-containing protein [Desulfobacteraceae bacterium]
MIYKNFARGRGSGSGASGPVKYATADRGLHFDPETGQPQRDELGHVLTYERDPKPVTVKGDPELAQALIDNCPHKRKYTSGVLSWEAGETVTPAQEKDIIKSFENTFFAGLESDQYHTLWVRHTHENHHELHVITPAQELTSGKFLNPDPPGKGNRALKDTWQSHINLEYGFSDPLEIERQKLSRESDYEAKIRAQATREGLQQFANKNQFKAAVHDLVLDKIANGQAKTREDIIKRLNAVQGFDVTRQGKNYITVTDSVSGQKTRLKGAIYEESWRFEPERDRTLAERERENSRDKGRRAGKVQQRLETLTQERFRFNQKRYGRDHGRHQERESEKTLDANLKRCADLDSFIGNQLGREQVSDIPFDGPGGVSTAAKGRGPGDFGQYANVGHISDGRPRKSLDHSSPGRDRSDRGQDAGWERSPANNPEIDKERKKTLDSIFKNENGIYKWSKFDHVAFVDKGNEVTFKSKSKFATRAGIQLAREKGWKGITVSSTDKKWLLDYYKEARCQGYEAKDLSFERAQPDRADLKKIEKEIKEHDRTRDKADRTAGKYAERADENNRKLNGASQQLADANRQLDTGLQQPVRELEHAAEKHKELTTSKDRGLEL